MVPHESMRYNCRPLSRSFSYFLNSNLARVSKKEDGPRRESNGPSGGKHF